MAGQNPTAFKDRHGFILDPTLEALWKTKATTLLHRILALLDSEGQAAMADKLRRGGYPGEDEFAYYTRFLGGDVLVTTHVRTRKLSCHSRLRTRAVRGVVCVESG